MNRRGGCSNRSSYRERWGDSRVFFISFMGLIDLPLLGRPFTWFKPNGNAMSCLDRIMKNMMNNSISLGMMLQLLQISG
ncbi:unnamed protein product [Trifolium pratense]|uniref:Uncharacterized protein n=1 Tax=Trifolium pratense TaxID=57577 RepID=A0ACB0J0U9_TRIPR|nr:unnamed protein product [Trifolium pratense]